MSGDGITYRRTAPDPKGMTVGDLRRFLAGLEGLDLPDDARVHVAATWRGTIKRLEVRT